VHAGHLRAAEEVRERNRLDEIRFVPAAVPVHKEAADIAPAEDRLRMVELAIADCPAFRAWDVELRRIGPSYSVDTIRTLRDEVGPDTRIVFVIGRDAFDEFHTWKEPETILALCDVVVITRPPWPETLSPDELRVAIPQPFDYDPASGTIRHASGRAVSLQHITALDISATAIRHMVSAGRSIRFLVPAAVAAYIADAGLYATGGQGRSR
jgi:nicotinate-nucleotide adenylyltransferase